MTHFCNGRTPFLTFVIQLILFGQTTGSSSSFDAGPAERSSNEFSPATATIRNLIDKVEQWQSVWSPSAKSDGLPFLTLTFAQSMDSNIALHLDGDNETATSSNYPISGRESLILTHALRSVHDGILIGGRTLSTDNPRLSNRHWDHSKVGLKQPRPIVLDSGLRHVRACLEGGGIRAKNLIVCCSEKVAAQSESIVAMDASISILPCKTRADNGQLDLCSVLDGLMTKFQIRRLMVEGGSAILSSFVQEQLVDCLCVTIAPKVLGSRGLSAFQAVPFDELEFGELTCVALGNDCIMLTRRIIGEL